MDEKFIKYTIITIIVLLAILVVMALVTGVVLIIEARKIAKPFVTINKVMEDTKSAWNEITKSHSVKQVVNDVKSFGTTLIDAGAGFVSHELQNAKNRLSTLVQVAEQRLDNAIDTGINKLQQPMDQSYSQNNMQNSIQNVAQNNLQNTVQNNTQDNAQYAAMMSTGAVGPHLRRTAC
jgi:hypothetical protein